MVLAIGARRHSSARHRNVARDGLPDHLPHPLLQVTYHCPSVRVQITVLFATTSSATPSCRSVVNACILQRNACHGDLACYIQLQREQQRCL